MTEIGEISKWPTIFFHDIDIFLRNRAKTYTYYRYILYIIYIQWTYLTVRFTRRLRRIITEKVIAIYIFLLIPTFLIDYNAQVCFIYTRSEMNLSPVAYFTWKLVLSLDIHRLCTQQSVSLSSRVTIITSVLYFFSWQVISDI